MWSEEDPEPWQDTLQELCICQKVIGHGETHKASASSLCQCIMGSYPRLSTQSTSSKGTMYQTKSPTL